MMASELKFSRAAAPRSDDTAKATQSAAQLVQVLNLNGLEKVEAGQQVTIEFRAAGLASSDTVLLLDAGSTSVSPSGWAADQYRTVGSTSASGAISTAGVANAGPADLYPSFAMSNYGVGGMLSYRLPVADGTYRIYLHLASGSEAVGSERFELSLQGAVVAASVDRRALAGATNKAIVLDYAVTAQDGEGIALGRRS